jgi:hypothetical protein
VSSGILRRRDRSKFSIFKEEEERVKGNKGGGKEVGGAII